MARRNNAEQVTENQIESTEADQVTEIEQVTETESEQGESDQAEQVDDRTDLERACADVIMTEKSKSAMIRALAAQGWSRGQIAKGLREQGVLGERSAYQHVRNVLIAAAGANKS